MARKKKKRRPAKARRYTKKIRHRGGSKRARSRKGKRKFARRRHRAHQFRGQCVVCGKPATHEGTSPSGRVYFLCKRHRGSGNLTNRGKVRMRAPVVRLPADPFKGKREREIARLMAGGMSHDQALRAYYAFL